MAIVTVEIFERSQEVREALIDGITEVMIANGAPREAVQVVLYELGPDVWGKGGKTFARRIAERRSEDDAPPPSA